MKILVVEDEKDIRELIHFNLFTKNYSVVLAADGEEAIDIASKELPNLILLDIMLPKKNGIDVCLQLKAMNATKNIPIIMLTAKGEEEDVVKGLNAGADDYIVKPFSPKVLLARVGVQLRKSDGGVHLKAENIDIDLDKRNCLIDGKKIDLTYSEFQILFTLMSKRGRVYTRKQIVELLRGQNHAVTDRSVDVQVVGLRKKMDIKGELIETVRGVGYRFKE